MELRIVLFALLAGCAPAVREPKPNAPIVELASHANVTVVIFFSRHCPCQAAHDDRLRALAETYAPQGVQFIAIDPEPDASSAMDDEERTKRRFPFPIVSDPTGASADALGAVYATYSVVLDRSGAVRYAGGIDSDRTHLTDDAETYLRDALDDTMKGRQVRMTHGKVLGCALSR